MVVVTLLARVSHHFLAHFGCLLGSEDGTLHYTVEWLSCARQALDHAPDHSRLTPYLTRRPPYLAPLVLYLNPILQGCYQVWNQGVETV